MKGLKRGRGIYQDIDGIGWDWRGVGVGGKWASKKGKQTVSPANFLRKLEKLRFVSKSGYFANVFRKILGKIQKCSFIL